MDGRSPCFKALGVAAFFLASVFVLVPSGEAVGDTGFWSERDDVAVGVSDGVSGRVTDGSGSYDADPLRLISNFQVTSYFGLTPDSFEVWVCEVPGGDLDITAEALVSFLTAELSPFYGWQSSGKYQLSFNVGGTVSPADLVACQDAVKEASNGGSRGALVFANRDRERSGVGGGWGGSGRSCSNGISVYVCHEMFPSNDRDAIIYAAVAVDDNWVETALNALENGFTSRRALFAVNVVETVAHEMGHLLAFPHSYTGATLNEYDNPMDLMSRGPFATYSYRSGNRSGWVSTDTLSGTIAVNRYAAGWIGPEQVDIYAGGLSSHTLAAIDTAGTQMLVIPSDTTGVFTALGTRIAKGYDSLLPKEGVEIYTVDQRSTACVNPFGGSCWGPNRRTRLLPGVNGDPTAHVLGPNESVEIRDGVTVTVVRRVGDTYVVEVDDGSTANIIPFSDVPAEHHAVDAIRWAYQQGITVGVGGGKFGMGNTLTREQMVTFLCRTYQPGECGNQNHLGSDRFVDVPVEHWANSSIGWAANLGITAGVDINHFGLGQILTREQIVTFLYRAEKSPATNTIGSTLYSDVPGDQTRWYQTPIGWAHSQGITGGIAEGTFGFGTALSRQEMVLLLCRTKAPHICPPSQAPLPTGVTPTNQ